MQTPKKRKNGKNKGNRAEREVAALVSKWWGSDFARTPSSGGFRTKKFREDWHAEGDLVTADETFPFSVECKWQEGWTLDQLLTSNKGCVWDWWKQTKGQTPKDKHPLLIFKRNNMPRYYMMESKCELNAKQMDFLTDSCLCVPVPQNYPEVVYVGLLDTLIARGKELWLTKTDQPDQ
jgi:hypothetical protein